MSEVVLEPGADPVPLRSAVSLDAVETMSIAVLVERLGRLSDERMRQVCASLAVAVDCTYCFRPCTQADRHAERDQCGIVTRSVTSAGSSRGA